MNNSKINTVHLIGSTGLYGAERWILALMRGLNPDDIKSTLINLVDDKNENSEVVKAAQQRGLDAFDFFTGGKFNPFAALRLARWLREHDIQVVHGHGFKSDMFALLAGRLAGCRVISTPHGWSVEKDWKLQAYEKLDRFLFRFMDLVCPLSEALLEGLRGKLWPAKMKLIFNGVDVEEVRSALLPQSQRDDFTIGYIGRLVPLKDVATLLQAIHLLVQKNVHVKLMVIGDGPERGVLEQQCQNLGLLGHVSFLGFKPDAASYLSSFDLFVLPSLSEGIPRCIMEAMAASVPVVVSDIPGCRDLVEHEKTGLLFEPANSADLAVKIQYMLEHPEKAAVMAAAGREKIDAEYSNMRMARDYAEVYRQLMSQ